MGWTRISCRPCSHCAKYKVSVHFSIKMAALVDDNANVGMTRHDVHLLKTGERFANVSGMDSDHQLSNFPIAGLVQMALLLPSLLPKWNNMERAGVLLSLVVTWKFTRSRWIILDPFMLVGNGRLRHEWTNFLMLFSPLIKQDWDPGTLPLDCDHPSTWPEKLLPNTKNT